MHRVSRGLNSIWYVDSGGSMHMTGCRYLINNFISQREGSVSFGKNAKGYVLGHGNVSSGKIQFDKVNLVENLEYNLLSVSQMCDKGYSSFFHKDSMQDHITRKPKDVAMLFSGH